AGLLLALPNPAASQDPAAKLLDTAKVWKVELRLSADNWQTMQPKGGGPPGFGPGGPMRPQPGGGPQRPQGFKFTYDFPYVRGEAAFDAETLADLGIRFKGN